MADQSDIQTPIFSSYKGRNEFSYWFLVKDESVTITSEIQADLKKFVKYALQHFDEYDIPRLKCELLGYHLENLYDAFHELGKTLLDGKICLRSTQCSNPGKKPPLIGLTREQKHIWIDINERIFRELACFPKLYLLKHAFDDYFKQITKTFKLVVDKDIDDFEWNVTVGRYMKELTFLRREREGEPLISKCIKEMRQELEKYDRIRPANQQINEFITRIKK